MERTVQKSLLSFDQVVVPKGTVCFRVVTRGVTHTDSLTAESVQSTSLPLQSVDHIHGGDGLPLGMLGVGDGIPDDVL